MVPSSLRAKANAGPRGRDEQPSAVGAEGVPQAGGGKLAGEPSWEVNRPKMLAALRARKADAALAHVLVDRFLKAKAQYLKAGMPPTDAREQAEQEWLLREPEEARPCRWQAMAMQ